MSETSEAYVDAAVDDLPEDVDAVLLGHVLQTALDDVVAVGVGAQHGDVPAQRVHDHLHHVRLLADLDEALDAARAVDVVGRLHDLALHLHQLVVTRRRDAYHFATLVVAADIQQLLEEVVAEGVHHQVGELVAHLVVDHGHDLQRALVQTLLQRATAVVVARHVLDVPAERLHVARLPRQVLGSTRHGEKEGAPFLGLVGVPVLDGTGGQVHRVVERLQRGVAHGGERALQRRRVGARREARRARVRHQQTRVGGLGGEEAARRHVLGVVGRGRYGRVPRLRRVVVHESRVVQIERVHREARRARRGSERGASD